MGRVRRDRFFILTFIGGCTGSTSGSIKVLRYELMGIFVRHQFLRLAWPRSVIPLTYRRRPLEMEVLRSAMSFFFLFLASFVLLSLALAAIGLDPITAISGAATALANVGPGLGEIIGPAGNLSSLPDAAKWMLSIGMLLGRLEFMTLIVLLLPAFWKMWRRFRTIPVSLNSLALTEDWTMHLIQFVGR